MDNNIKQMKDDCLDLNFDTIIDTYMPPMPKVTTDQPLRPRDFKDVCDLQKNLIKYLWIMIFDMSYFVELCL